MKHYFNNRINKPGMTLVELITGMLVVAVVLSAVAAVISTSVTTMNTVNIRKKILMDGYYASAKFIREFRSIVEKPDLLVAQSKKTRFIVSDTLTVEWELTGSTLTRFIIGNPQAQIMTKFVDVANSNFIYYDTTQTELIPPIVTSDVWRARLRLTMTDGSNDLVFVADVFPENYK